MSEMMALVAKNDDGCCVRLRMHGANFDIIPFYSYEDTFDVRGTVEHGVEMLARTIAFHNADVRRELLEESRKDCACNCHDPEMRAVMENLVEHRNCGLCAAQIAKDADEDSEAVAAAIRKANYE